jgi:hypothetical protein
MLTFRLKRFYRKAAGLSCGRTIAGAVSGLLVWRVFDRTVRPAGAMDRKGYRY